MNDKVYFHLYEDRYRRLREQGVEDWISNPEELARTISNVDDFLKYAHCDPSSTSLIELGCGQGHLGIHLLKTGYKYLGVDISELAIKQTRKKIGLKDQNAFLIADITELKQFPDKSFDIAIDNQCFHLLITDEHRRKYLAEVKRILKKNGKMFLLENFQKKEFKEVITSLQAFNDKFQGDRNKLRNFWAYMNDKSQEIKLPMIPARANNEAGYRKEMISAGFTVELFKNEKNQCVFYVCSR
jgi:ubiquinone/menaquinone biosynthesis C-methylase UbiE